MQSLGSFINPINSNNNIDKFQGISNTTFSIQSEILNEKDSKKQQEKHLLQLQQAQLQELQQTHNLNKSTTNRILMDIIKPISNDISEPPTLQVIANHDHSRNTNNEHHFSSHSNSNSNLNNNKNTNQIHNNDSNNNYQYDESKDRKYIIPLALKTTASENPKTPTTVQHGSSANIDDLKKHIMMLQNFTANDKNFQSKFVVFPKLQRNGTEAPPATAAPIFTTTIVQRTSTMQFPVTMYRPKPSINLPRDLPSFQTSPILRDVSQSVVNHVERVTIVPQVFLQNDQTPESTPDELAEAKKKENRKNRKNNNGNNPLKEKERQERRERRRKNKDKKQKLLAGGAAPSTTLSTTTSTTMQPITTPKQLSAPERKAFRRQNRRKKLEEQKSAAKQSLTTTPASTQKTFIINLSDKHVDTQPNSTSFKKLNRNIRSHSMNFGTEAKRKNAGRKKNLNKMQRDIIMPMLPTDLQAITKNESVEKIDLNPKHCYEVGGLSRGQQKLCEQYTSIMPAISRGARSAIQVSPFFVLFAEIFNWKTFSQFDFHLNFRVLLKILFFCHYLD